MTSTLLRSVVLMLVMKVSVMLEDPCYSYTVLDQPWRASNYYSFPPKCDASVTNWFGWYRLFLNGQSVRMAESCVEESFCGSDIPLWLSGGHPTVGDGEVTRAICAHWRAQCCYFWTFDIRVKACPNNYYVYELIRPPIICNNSYCADVKSVNSTNTTAMSLLNSTGNLSDPCHNYTALDDSRRATDYSNSRSCDASVSWRGWYRLFLNGQNTQMPETCVQMRMCGTDAPLWLSGGHPNTQDGVVTRNVCGHWNNSCCYYHSYPIRVKACPNNYYVYEFVRPVACSLMYCADASNITKQRKNPAITSAGSNLTLLSNCTGISCVENLFEQMENITVLPLNDVTKLLDKVFSTSEILNTSSADPDKLVADGNRLLKASDKLVSMLVKPTDTSEKVSFTLDSVEGQIFMVGPKVSLVQIPQLNTTHASINIDLIGIADNNYEKSAAVAFMTFNTMEKLLRSDLFNTSDDTVKTMMSTIISATLPKTTNKELSKPVNFTFKHIREFKGDGTLFCVYWNITEWIVDGCSVVKINSSFTVCSCVHLSTFALIMQTSSSSAERDELMDLVNLVAVIVGLVFNSLALLTFAFCRWKPGVNNVARINLCISLLSAHLLFLLTQQFLTHIQPHTVLCAVLAGVLHFLFLSCFVWMFIEAVLLFICVKNLSQISSKQRAVLSSRFLIVIGYVIAFVIVGVSVGLVPEGYGSEHCWIKMDKGLIWSFLGPVCFILAINMILFISIIISLNSSLTKLNAGISQMKQTKIVVFKTLAQVVVLGCSWILGFFTNSSKIVEIVFLILNSQQGTFIFLLYCVLNSEVRQQYVKCLRALSPGLKPKTINSAPKRH